MKSNFFEPGYFARARRETMESGVVARRATDLVQVPRFSGSAFYIPIALEFIQADDPTQCRMSERRTRVKFRVPEFLYSCPPDS